MTSLGTFIRRHRERLNPAEAGVRSFGRRRTPGLRREELAQACGVSTTWITWLEQGREISASAQTLARLAEALHLSAAERRYLFTLAGKLDPSRPLTHLVSPADTVLRSVHMMAMPAYVLDREWNALTWNPQASDLFTGWLDEPAPRDNLARNQLHFLFLHPAARTLIASWEERARRLVAEFRADCSRSLEDPSIHEQVAALCAASPEFAGFWQAQDVFEREGGQRVFQHPHAGTLVFEQLTLRPATRPDLKLVMLLPA